MKLVLGNIGHLVTINPGREILRDAYVAAEDGWITAVGSGECPAELLADAEVVDARGGIATPGLINTHHHMFQNLARAFTPISNLPLYPWIQGHMPLWRHLTPDALHLAGQVAMAELMLTGCTTTSDHHYVYPKGCGISLEPLFRAASILGIRLTACRGSMDQASEIIPEFATQTIDEILSDSLTMVARFHDRSPGSMNQVALAPSAVLSVTGELLSETARLADAENLRLHIHCGETTGELQRSDQLHRCRPLSYLARRGWDNGRVWLAHGIHFNDGEVRHIGEHGMGVAHCPCANMRLGSGVCRVNDLRAAGAAVSLGVDGSASNDSGNLLGEVRQALMLTRVAHGAGAMTVEQALELVTLEGARNLGRERELGSVEVGKCADLAVFPAFDLHSSGVENRVHGLILCHPRQVDTLVVHGRVRVRDGRIPGLDLTALLQTHDQAARRLVHLA